MSLEMEAQVMRNVWLTAKFRSWPEGSDLSDLGRAFAENLAWYGFEPVINHDDVDNQSETTVEYFAQNFKGSFDWLLSWIFDKRTSEIELVPDTPSEADYRVVLGNDYDPCRPQLFAPQIFVSQ